MFIHFRRGQKKLQDGAYVQIEKAREELEPYGIIERLTKKEDQDAKDLECDRLNIPRVFLPVELILRPNTKGR